MEEEEEEEEATGLSSHLTQSGSRRGARGFVPDKGKPWPLANKFNPMTGISLRGENHITNIQKRYTTARCITLPATSSIEN